MRRVLNTIIDIYRKLVTVLSREQKSLGILVLFMSAVGAVLELFGVGIILPLVQSFLDIEALKEKQWVVYVIDMFNIKSDNTLIIVMTIAVIILFLIKDLYFMLLTWVRSKYSCKILRELSAYIMRTYLYSEYEFFLSTNTAELARDISADSSGVDTIVIQFLKMFVDGLTILFIITYIFITDVVMALAISVLSMLCLIFVLVIFKRVVKEAGKSFFYYHKQSSKYMLEALNGIKEVISSGKQEFFINAFDEANIKRNRASITQAVATESPAYIIEMVCVAGLLGTVCFKIINGDTSAAGFVPMLSAFAMGAFRILPALGRISSEFNTITYYMPCLNRTYNNMQRYEMIQKKNEERRGKFKGEIDCINSDIELSGIMWKYSNSDKIILNGLNLTIRKGESVAFVGRSGAGKTTLADIILGLLHPDIGKISIDGRDILSGNETVNKAIAYVPQSVFLIDDTIRRNIAFGIEDKLIDEVKINEAVKDSQLAELIKELPNGLDTKVGDRGIRLSGGQRQRIAIARALYSNSEVLIFDEATAALDNETELAVMDAINTLKGNKTIIIIAHRLTTIKECDTIYEIADGKAVKVRYEDIISGEEKT